jgi:hypothetical protein
VLESVQTNHSGMTCVVHFVLNKRDFIKKLCLAVVVVLAVINHNDAVRRWITI